MPQKRKAVFLDRDGVINEDRADYVKEVSELVVFPFIPAAVRILGDAGFDVFVVSNQQGVGKGILSEPDLQEIDAQIERRAAEAGGRISAFYYCTHLAADKCSCRKPLPGLLTKAAEDHNIDLRASVMIGDSERDIMAGKMAGCRTVLVLTGKITREDSESVGCKPDYVADDLLQATTWIVQ